MPNQAQLERSLRRLQHTWYRPGSTRIGSEWGLWQLWRAKNDFESRPTRLHANPNCKMLRKAEEYPSEARTIDIFLSPEGKEYIIDPREGTHHQPRYCKFCHKEDTSGHTQP